MPVSIVDVYLCRAEQTASVATSWKGTSGIASAAPLRHLPEASQPDGEDRRTNLSLARME